MRLAALAIVLAVAPASAQRDPALRPVAAVRHDVVLAVGGEYDLATDARTHRGLVLAGLDVRAPIGPVLLEVQLAHGFDSVPPALLHWVSNVRFGAGVHVEGDGYRAQIVGSIVAPSLRLDPVRNHILSIGGIGPFDVTDLADVLAPRLEIAGGEWDSWLWLIDTTSAGPSMRLELDARGVATFAMQADLLISFEPAEQVHFRPQVALEGAARLARDTLWLGLTLRAVVIAGRWPRDPTLSFEPFVRLRFDERVGAFAEVALPIVAVSAVGLGSYFHMHALRISGAFTY